MKRDRVMIWIRRIIMFSVLGWYCVPVSWILIYPLNLLLFGSFKQAFQMCMDLTKFILIVEDDSE